MKMPNRFAVLFLAAALLLSLHSPAAADTKADVDRLTGGIHTRVAWREGGDQIRGRGNAIKGFDSQTGKTHTIYDGSCVKAVICAGGHKVLFTGGDYKVYVIDWEGTNKKLLTSGSVSDGWRDPATGKDWAVYRANGKSTSGGIYRVLIEDPSQKVRIYNGAEGHDVYPWFQMSADGKYGASYFPHGGTSGGLLNIETGKLNKITAGCWAGMASDNSYNWMRLDNGHKGIVTFNKTTRLTSVDAMPPISGQQLYCPRPAEGPEHGGLFFTLSGGYPGYNKNGNGVEIFLGKLTSSYDAMAPNGWARITNNNVPDQHPTAWIGVEGGEAKIGLSTTELSFSATQGGGQPQSKSVTVESESGTLSNVQVESDQQWLTVTLQQSGSQWTIDNEVDLTGLDAKIHTATVTVSAANAVPASKSYVVSLTVAGAPVATSIDITPADTTVEPGATVTYNAVVLDQYNNPLEPQPALAWSSSDQSVISTGGGAFTAPEASEVYTVKAETGDLSATAKMTVELDVSITLTSSHGAQQYAVGQEVQITWDATSDINMNLWLSTDGGRTWMLILEAEAPSIKTVGGKGSYLWTIPATIDGQSVVGSQAKLKVEAYWDPNTNATSEMFEIQQSISARPADAAVRRDGIGVRRMADKGYAFRVAGDAPYRIAILDARGAEVASFTGAGNGAHRWGDNAAAGAYLVRISRSGISQTYRLVVSER